MKKILFVLLFLSPLSISTVFGQDLYDSTRIQEIRIYFSNPNWRSVLNANAALATEPYALAQRVVINGVSFDSVGAKFKGNSSFRAMNKKNPWHIELDYVKNQDYQGYKDIKLANVFSDPTFVREALSYELMQPYADLPRANFANVYVNDTLQGLYTNTEAVTKTFCKNHFPSSDFNVFVKGNAPSFGGGSPNLTYLGADTALYTRSYEMNSAYGWRQLVNFIDTLNNRTTAIEKVLDVDRTLWMLGFNVLFVNLDSYTGGFTQNYYLWRDDNNRFNPIIWDVNMSFGSFTNAGAGISSDSMGLAKLSPLVHATNTTKPLISKILSNERYKKMYIAHLRTMKREQFSSGKYLTRALGMQRLIDADVQRDVNKFYTYTQFKQNLYYRTTSLVGIVSLMSNKIAYLDTLAIMREVPPTISNVAAASTRLGDTAWITTRVSGNTANGVLIGYRVKATDYFTRVVMFDDGLHRDGAANDGLFGVGIKLVNPTMQYYIWAENATAGIFSPERAEHEFHTLNASFLQGDIVINELMASNTSTVTDPSGEYNDWVELYNTSAASVNISNWRITDDPANLNKWKFPQGTIMPANSYLIVWADEDSSQNTATSFHANFKLSAVGESLTLSKPDGTISDAVTYGAQTANISYARRPNGTGNFVFQTATFQANNNTGTTSTADILSEKDVEIFPNPAHTEGGVTIRLNTPKTTDVQVYNILGEAVFQGKMQETLHLDTDFWHLGIYIVKVGNISRKLVVR